MPFSQPLKRIRLLGLQATKFDHGEARLLTIIDPLSIPEWALRPMSTGQLLDHTFTLYRKIFFLLVGIAAVGSLTGQEFQLVKTFLTLRLDILNLQRLASTGDRRPDGRAPAYPHQVGNLL
jgi:hypothetical protein